MTLPGGIPPTLVPEAGAVLAASAAKATSGSIMFDLWTLFPSYLLVSGYMDLRSPCTFQVFTCRPGYHFNSDLMALLSLCTFQVFTCWPGYHGPIRVLLPSLIRHPTWRLIIMLYHFKGQHSNRRSNCQFHCAWVTSCLPPRLPQHHVASWDHIYFVASAVASL